MDFSRTSIYGWMKIAPEIMRVTGKGAKNRVIKQGGFKPVETALCTLMLQTIEYMGVAIPF